VFLYVKVVDNDSGQALGDVEVVVRDAYPAASNVTRNEGQQEALLRLEWLDFSYYT